MSEDIQQLDMFANGSDSQATEPQEAKKAPESVGSKPRANDLDGKTWTRYSISIWSDLRKTAEENQLKHPAMFPLALANRALECFTSKSDHVVLDPFVGVGTTVLAARNAGKYGIGIEISPEFAAITRTRLAQNPLFEEISGGDSTIHVDDARNLLKYVQPGIVDFCLTSPPYWDILLQPRTADYKEQRDYGEAEADLGKIGDYERFLQALMDIMRNVWVSLRPGKYCLMVVMDLRKKARFYPFHADVADAMQEIGFLYDDLIIWDRRHEYNNMRPLGYPYTFRINKAHEFILIFQKPRTSPEP